MASDSLAAASVSLPTPPLELGGGRRLLGGSFRLLGGSSGGSFSRRVAIPPLLFSRAEDDEDESPQCLDASRHSENDLPVLLILVT